MHQGATETEARNWNMEPYRPKELDFILITHAHIDHTGLLPRLVKEGFSGPIHATSATRDLMEIMLMDSAHIQEMEAEWRNKKSKRQGQRLSEPLYTQADVEKTLSLIRPLEYNQELVPCPGFTAVFRDAGHILGSSVIELCYEEGGVRRKVVFSGDLGRPNQLLISDPTPVQTADFLFVESTYGDRDHKNEDRSRDELAEAIAYAYQNREKVIIPAFAVGRTQELLYTLHLLAADGRLPADMPVFVDSPLAIKATEIFRRNPAYLDEEARSMLANGDNPLKLKNLKFTLKTDESQAINSVKGSAVVISASGMANAGRIKHHLRHNLWRKGAAVVFAGYQALGTPGRKIVDGAKKIRLLGEEVAVNAKVFTIGGFSAHAGLSQLLAWMENFRGGHPEIILVHGEPRSPEEPGRADQGRLRLDRAHPRLPGGTDSDPGARSRPPRWSRSGPCPRASTGTSCSATRTICSPSCAHGFPGWPPCPGRPRARSGTGSWRSTAWWWSWSPRSRPCASSAAAWAGGPSAPPRVRGTARPRTRSARPCSPCWRPGACPGRACGCWTSLPGAAAWPWRP